jgi:hypothetical protein
MENKLKKRSISEIKNLKDFLYSKKGTLTQEEINKMVNKTIESVIEYAYDLGWEHCNDLHRDRKSDLKLRLIKAWNEFYNKNVGKFSSEMMEELQYIYDIEMLHRYFNEDLSITRQMNNMDIF